MVLRKILFVLLVLWINGCASAGSSRHEAGHAQGGRTLASIYSQARDAHKTGPASAQGIRLTPDAGEDSAYFPVYESGRIEKVWVPAHVAREDKDILVAGHWVFLMVEEPHWYIQAHEPEKMFVPVISATGPGKE